MQLYQGHQDGLQFSLSGREDQGLQIPSSAAHRSDPTRGGGADAFYITAIQGHADVNTSQSYTIATNEGLKRAMESLTRRRGQTVTEVPTSEERLPEPTAVSA